jgi:hypothetical protein
MAHGKIKRWIHVVSNSMNELSKSWIQLYP